MSIRHARLLLVAACALAWPGAAADDRPRARNVILMVADGAGFNTWKATAIHERRVGRQIHDGPEWIHTAVSTYALRRDASIPVGPEHGEVQLPHLVYDPARAWDGLPVEGGDGDYPFHFRGYRWLRETAPDSASTMSSMVTGRKTFLRSINVDGTGMPVEETLAHLAHTSGRKVGVVTSVTLSHATPAAGGGAHHPSRYETVALTQQLLSSDALDVLVGCGHPEDDNNGEPVDDERDRVYDHVGGRELWSILRGSFVEAEHAEWTATQGSGAIAAYRAWTLVDDRAEIEALAGGDTPGKLLVVPRCGQRRFWGGTALPPPAMHPGEGTGGLPVAKPVKPIRLGGTLQQQRGSRADPVYTPPGYDPRVESVPDLPTLAKVALRALGSDDDGFFLHIEAGAVDWAMHETQFGRMVEEMSEFHRTVEAVVEWIEANGGWDETLLVLTADHDHMLWGPDAHRVPFDPIGEGPPGRVQYRWLYDSHSNALVPLHARGAGAERLLDSVDGSDPFYGPYIDQTDIFTALRAAMAE